VLATTKLISYAEPFGISE